LTCNEVQHLGIVRMINNVSRPPGTAHGVLASPEQVRRDVIVGTSRFHGRHGCSAQHPAGRIGGRSDAGSGTRHRGRGGPGGAARLRKSKLGPDIYQ